MKRYIIGPEQNICHILSVQQALATIGLLLRIIIVIIIPLSLCITTVILNSQVIILS